MNCDEDSLSSATSPPNADAQLACLVEIQRALSNVADLDEAARLIVDRSAAIFGAVVTLDLFNNSLSSSPVSASFGSQVSRDEPNRLRADAATSSQSPSAPLHDSCWTGVLQGLNGPIGRFTLLFANRDLARYADPLLPLWAACISAAIELRIERTLRHSRSVLDASALADFAGRLGHDLRSPMGSALMWTHVARVASGTERDAAISAIESGIREQNGMIVDLVDLMRARAHRLPSVRQSATLDDCLDKVWPTVLPYANSRNVELLRSPSREPSLSLVADIPRLVRALSNLVAQAVRSADQGDRILVGCVREGRSGRIELQGAFARAGADSLNAMMSRFAIDQLGQDSQTGGPAFCLAFAREIIESSGGDLSIRAASQGDSCPQVQITFADLVAS